MASAVRDAIAVSPRYRSVDTFPPGTITIMVATLDTNERGVSGVKSAVSVAFVGITEPRNYFGGHLYVSGIDRVGDLGRGILSDLDNDVSNRRREIATK
ncbi:hypothetical protein LLG88_13570 [bacterium]|nr:hypothetical protein [bacterium]